MAQYRLNFYRALKTLILVSLVAYAFLLFATKVIDWSKFGEVTKYFFIVVTIVGSVWFVVIAFFWRFWPLRWILKIPDFSGRWEGWYFKALSGDIAPTAHEFDHRGDQIEASAWGGGNQATVRV